MLRCLSCMLGLLGCLPPITKTLGNVALQGARDYSHIADPRSLAVLLATHSCSSLAAVQSHIGGKVCNLFTCIRIATTRFKFVRRTDTRLGLAF